MQFRALYKDGTNFEWDDDISNGKGYDKIDRTKLVGMELYHEGSLVHRLHLEDGQRLIYRRRPLFSMTNVLKGLVYLVGYQETVQGKNRQAILGIFADGHTELIGSWKNAPLNEINLRDDEKGVI